MREFVNRIKAKSDFKYINYTIAFSLFYSYLLSFVFEGKVFYILANKINIAPSTMVVYAILLHFIGLNLSGFYITNASRFKRLMVLSPILCAILLLPFYGDNSFLWNIALSISALVSGGVVSSWGFFLKNNVVKNNRLSENANILILSNILMMVLNLSAIYISPIISLALCQVFLITSAIMIFRQPLIIDSNSKTESNDTNIKNSEKNNKYLNSSIVILIVFIVIITINSGLMYKFVNPAYAEFELLVNWYWAIPYIVALMVLRKLKSNDIQKPVYLYSAIAMMMASFIFFLVLEKTSFSYIIVNTLMLGAFGVFDLFWWTVIGEMLEYSNNPAKLFGIGLSSNVFGVFIGNIIANYIIISQNTGSSITITALTVICITLLILPKLNERLLNLLVGNYIDEIRMLQVNSKIKVAENEVSEEIPNIDETYDNNLEELIYAHESVEAVILADYSVAPNEPLSDREIQVFELLIQGKTNKTIAELLFISENTIKTHTRNIYAKYKVSSKSELISKILSNK